jgi:hypothetical protein
MELKFRDLRADEIECRVGNTKRKNNSKPKSEDNPVVGFQILLYKNARVDANILDETVGPFNWTKKFYQVKNTMFCEVAIRDKDTGEWVAKSDCGDDDFQTEQIKGEASDSFKRACFAWSLGRLNLYYGPFIWIKCNQEVNEYTKFYVSEVEYDDHIISKLVIKDRISDNVLYSYTKKANAETITPKPEKQTDPNTVKGSIKENEKMLIKAFLETLDADKCAQWYKWLDSKFHTMNYELLSAEQGVIVCKTWKLI